MLGDNQFIEIKTHNDLSGVARFPIAKIPGSPPPINPPITPPAETAETHSEDPDNQSLSTDYS